MTKTTLVFFLTLLTFSTVSLNNDSLQSLSYLKSDVEPIYETFCMPIRFNRSGIQYFLRNVFNHPHYSSEYLPHNFSHFIQFLQEGQRQKQNRMYMEATVRLFLNKLKASRYISGYAFSDMLAYLPDIMKDYCIKCEPESFLIQAKTIVKDTLYSYFLNKFSFFKQEPDNFFEDLSDEIVKQFSNHDSMKHNVECEELKQTVIRFLEIGLLKTIWPTDDQMMVWESVKKISEQLTALLDAQIINHDELDDLFKTLIESFCHFLDLAGSELSLETINAIKEDISSKKLLLLDLEEQEEILETKVDRLARVLIDAEARVHARLRGIITENIVCR